MELSIESAVLSYLAPLGEVRDRRRKHSTIPRNLQQRSRNVGHADTASLAALFARQARGTCLDAERSQTIHAHLDADTNGRADLNENLVGEPMHFATVRPEAPHVGLRNREVLAAGFIFDQDA